MSRIHVLSISILLSRVKFILSGIGQVIKLNAGDDEITNVQLETLECEANTAEEELIELIGISQLELLRKDIEEAKSKC